MCTSPTHPTPPLPPDNSYTISSTPGPPLDVWAMGVILFSILCGRLPFEGSRTIMSKRPMEAIIKEKIIKCQYTLTDTLSNDAKVIQITVLLCSVLTITESYYLSIIMNTTHHIRHIFFTLSSTFPFFFFPPFFTLFFSLSLLFCFQLCYISCSFLLLLPSLFILLLVSSRSGLGEAYAVSGSI